MMLGSMNGFYQGQSITTGTWNLVTAGFSVKSDMMSYMASLSISSGVSGTAYSSFKTEDSWLMPAISIDSTNLFKIGGGFTGHVYQFKLFSPGMHIMSSRQKFFFSFSSKSPHSFLFNKWKSRFRYHLLQSNYLIVYMRCFM